jgi:hypothetical protein
MVTRRAVSYDEGLKVAQMYDMEFCETSALQDFNVKVAFSRSAIKILNKINRGLLTINKDVTTSHQGTQGVRANLAFRNGNFLPPSYLQELRRDGGNTAVELKAKNNPETQAECRVCCE